MAECVADCGVGLWSDSPSPIPLQQQPIGGEPVNDMGGVDRRQNILQLRDGEIAMDKESVKNEQRRGADIFR